MNTTKLLRFTLFIFLCGLFCADSLPVAAQARFRVTMSGFIVNRQSNEGLRAVDGANDEVRFLSFVGRLDAAGGYTFGRDDSVSVMRGITTGSRTISPARTFYDDEIGENTRAVLIIPSIWEWDDASDVRLFANYETDIGTSSRGTLPSLLAAIVSSNQNRVLISGTSLGINFSTMRKLAGGYPQDRPIGMNATTAINEFEFMPKGLILTRDSANFFASQRDRDFGPGIVRVRYVDASGMGGDYTLLLRVERTDPGSSVNPCPSMPDLTSTFSGTATMTITNPNNPNDTIGPIPTNISVPVEFTQCRTRVRIPNFPTVMTPAFMVNTPVGPRSNVTTITQTGGGTGRFDPGTGRVEIPITFHFQHSLERQFTIFARPSDLTVNLTTREVGGSKKDAASGLLTLVEQRTAQFTGGFLGGRIASLTVTGNFEPRPR